LNYKPSQKYHVALPKDDILEMYSGNRYLRFADRYLFASQAIKINPRVFLLFFRQLDETCQPLDDAMKAC
jgi:hypothetical protein